MVELKALCCCKEKALSRMRMGWLGAGNVMLYRVSHLRIAEQYSSNAVDIPRERCKSAICFCHVAKHAKDLLRCCPSVCGRTPEPIGRMADWQKGFCQICSCRLDPEDFEFSCAY